MGLSPSSPTDFVVDCEEDRDGVGGAAVEGGVVGVVLSPFIGLIRGSLFGVGALVVEEAAVIVEVDTAIVSHWAVSDGSTSRQTRRRALCPQTNGSSPNRFGS